MKTTMSQELVDNLSSFCESRKAVYELLSRCFEKEISPEAALAIACDFRFESNNEQLVQAYENMTQSLAGVTDVDIEQLAVIFNRVFYGMGPRTAQKAFPYESVYTSGQGLMMQKAYAEVRSIYLQDGFAKSQDFPEPEDHLAVELSYMATLCKQCLESIQHKEEDDVAQLLEKQLDFLRNHILNWIDSLSSDMKGSAEEGFYWHLAAFANDFLKEDEKALEEVLGC